MGNHYVAKKEYIVLPSSIFYIFWPELGRHKRNLKSRLVTVAYWTINFTGKYQNVNDSY